MENQQNQINLLNEKLRLLLQKQQEFAKEIQEIHEEIRKLPQTNTPVKNEISEVSKPESIPLKNQPTSTAPVQSNITPKTTANVNFNQKSNTKYSTLKKSSIEKFIGENLINKVGIAILVIGIIIGAKYSIENNLISPLTRIILGYLAGLGLLGFGIKLKSKYENYSAVLVSGALATLYFITFSAYNFYDLLPQLLAFGLMLLFTIFGVVAALNYDKQIIAHFGLVGAYAVPFLLSNDSGNTTVLFSYIAIINTGILLISFKKYWKPLYRSAFIFTWLIYAVFRVFTYKVDTHLHIALLFLFIFFAQFYTVFLAYRLKTNERFRKADIILLLLNAFFFYGLGYGIISGHSVGKEMLGLFTLINALIHFIVSTIIYKKKLADRNLFYLVSGMVLVFITIAIPVQLDGNWVTLLWVIEAALLYWIGRSKNVRIYEQLAYPLIFLAFFSLLQDWGINYSAYLKETHFRSILNITFLSSVLFAIACGFMNWVYQKTKNTVEVAKRNWSDQLMSYVIPILFVLVIYGAFYLEIDYYFDKLYWLSEIPKSTNNDYSYTIYNSDLKKIGTIWLLNYTLLFVAILAYVNTIKFKHRVFGIVTLGIGVIATFLFLGVGLYILSELRESFLQEEQSEFFEKSNLHIIYRYASIGFLALTGLAMYKLVHSKFMTVTLKIPFELLMHISILWLLSSELLHWMDLIGSNQTYKLGLSILWGAYALLLISIGIFKTKSYLRIGAIVLFAVTLIKLFFYDIAAMNTITKTVVFVSLGIFLLIISFLYNKYKHKIADD